MSVYSLSIFRNMADEDEDDHEDDNGRGGGNNDDEDDDDDDDEEDEGDLPIETGAFDEDSEEDMA